MICKKLAVMLAALGALAFLVAGSGCAGDEPAEVGSCAVASDCADNETCTDGVCEPIAEGECEEDAQCTDVPEASCSGDDLVTYRGVCYAEDSTCEYAIDETVTCPTGCSDGACNPDLCEDVACTPPEATCVDADTLEIYTGADCEDGDCTYESEQQGCVHGCADGACNQGACDAATCDDAPEPECEGNTYVEYADEGQCFQDENDAAVCTYEKSYTNCDYTGGTCDVVAGGCVDEMDQAGGVVIVEYMANPTGISDYEGEWFEIVNTSGDAIDLMGWHLESGTSGDSIEEHLLEDAEAVPSFPDGARLVFANSDDPAGDGSVTPDYVYGNDISLANTPDWIHIVNLEGHYIDRVFWEAGTVIAGKSRKLGSEATVSSSANDDFASWCPELDEGYGAHDNFGTPGAANPACSAQPCQGVVCERPDDFCNYDGNAIEYTLDDAMCQVSRFSNPYCDFEPVEVKCTEVQYCLSGVCEDIPGELPEPGEVIFTEFMGNPSHIFDADGEYIELYNTTDRELTLFTLSISDDETGRSHNSFVIEDLNASVGAGEYVVLAANLDDTQNGGITDALQLYDSPLKNDLDAAGLTITLARQDGTTVDDAYYGAPTGGASQQLSRDAYESVSAPGSINDTADNFCDATEADANYTSGDLGSPGVANEVCGG